MKEGFPSRDRDDGGTALFRRDEAVFHGKASVKNFLRISNLSAADTPEVTSKQGLQHQDEWIAVISKESLTDEVTSNMTLLQERDSHLDLPMLTSSTSFVMLYGSGQLNTPFWIG